MPASARWKAAVLRFCLFVHTDSFWVYITAVTTTALTTANPMTAATRLCPLWPAAQVPVFFFIGLVHDPDLLNGQLQDLFLSQLLGLAHRDRHVENRRVVGLRERERHVRQVLADDGLVP